MMEKKKRLAIIVSGSFGEGLLEGSKYHPVEGTLIGENDNPNGYDIYIIHLGDTDDQEVKKLRNNNPSSKIYVFNGSGKISAEMKEITDASYWSPDLQDNLDDILG